MKWREDDELRHLYDEYRSKTGVFEMGPYCNYCNQRCFCHLTEEMWNIPEVRAIYERYRAQGGYIPDIIATCQGGQTFEKERIGICYGDIQRLLETASAQKG